LDKTRRATADESYNFFSKKEKLRREVGRVEEYKMNNVENNGI
jgi:hypothetical protein